MFYFYTLNADRECSVCFRFFDIFLNNPCNCRYLICIKCAIKIKLCPFCRKDYNTTLSDLLNTYKRCNMKHLCFSYRCEYNG